MDFLENNKSTWFGRLSWGHDDSKEIADFPDQEANISPRLGQRCCRTSVPFPKTYPDVGCARKQKHRTVSGVAASPVTQMVNVATRGRLAAFDLSTEKNVREHL